MISSNSNSERTPRKGAPGPPIQVATRVVRAFVTGALVTPILLFGAALAWVGEGSFTERTERLIFIGNPLIEVQRPTPGQEIPFGGVEVRVGFAEGDRVALDTFRCLLNGRDVTDLLELSAAGATGSIFGLVEGENRIKIEVFGRSWWSERHFQDARTVVFHVRPYPNMDRAFGAPMDRASGAPVERA